MRIIMFGPPGSGKGTYSGGVCRKLGIPHISTGDMLRSMRDDPELGETIRQAQDSGGYVSDEIVLDVVRKRLSQDDAKKGFIFDGFPRTLKQAEELDRMGGVDVVINLNVPDWIIIKRLSARRTCRGCRAIFNLLFPSLKPKEDGKCDKCGGELYQRDDETEEAVKERLKIYNDLTKPLIDFYRKKGFLRDVVNDKLETPPEPVIEKILEVLKEFMK